MNFEEYLKPRKLKKRWGYLITISAILAFLVLVLMLLEKYIFGIQFDSSYWNNFLAGLIPNVLSILITIWIVDSLLRKREYEQLEVINKHKSEGIYSFINRLVWKILVHFDAMDEKAGIDEMAKTGDLDMEFALKKFLSLSENEVNEIFTKKFFTQVDHKKFSEDTKKLISKEVEIINKMIHEIHPLADLEIVDFFEIEIVRFLSSLEVLATMTDIPNISDFSKFYPSGEEAQLEKEKLRNALSHVMPVIAPYTVGFNRLMRGLLRMSALAKSNQLFLKH